MEILKPAIAGTLESSDAQVKIGRASCRERVSINV